MCVVTETQVSYLDSITAEVISLPYCLQVEFLFPPSLFSIKAGFFPNASVGGPWLLAAAPFETGRAPVVGPLRTGANVLRKKAVERKKRKSFSPNNFFSRREEEGVELAPTTFSVYSRKKETI